VILPNQEKQEARTGGEAGFVLRVLPRERGYANHGHLLPMLYVEQAVEPGVSAIPLVTPSTYRISNPAGLTIGKTLTQPSGKGDGPSHRTESKYLGLLLAYGHVAAIISMKDT
jgi:hypothetical protein